MTDAQRRTAAYTGRACIGWCGNRAGDGFSVAGNMLAGERVACLPSRDHPADVIDRKIIEREIARFQAERESTRASSGSRR